MDYMPTTSKGICKNNKLYFPQVKSVIFEADAFDPQHWEQDARMLKLTDFNGKDVALPLPSFEGAALDAL